MQNTFGNTFWPSIVTHLAGNYDGKTISSVSGIYKSAALIDPSILYKANAVREWRINAEINFYALTKDAGTIE